MVLISFDKHLDGKKRIVADDLVGLPLKEIKRELSETVS